MNPGCQHHGGLDNPLLPIERYQNRQFRDIPEERKKEVVESKLKIVELAEIKYPTSKYRSPAQYRSIHDIKVYSGDLHFIKKNVKGEQMKM